MSLDENAQSRKFQLTINNPVEHGFAHIDIINICQTVLKCDYFALVDEQGSCYHTHVFIYRSSPVKVTYLKKLFPPAHIEFCKGTCKANRDYLLKQGKHADKSETQIDGTFEEFGDIPLERQGSRSDLVDLYDMIKSGKSDCEIISANPNYMFRLRDIQALRNAYIEDAFSKMFRQLEVVYIYGSAGVGKSRSVLDMFGYSNVYRVTDYQHAFDTYNYQDVLVFEEFRSNFSISQMLNYLDGYPLRLPARYFDRQAVYTKVFLITNIPLELQYHQIQIDQPETWQGFLRRINKVRYFDKTGKITEWLTMDYINRHKPEEDFQPIGEQEALPFV